MPSQADQLMYLFHFFMWEQRTKLELNP